MNYDIVMCKFKEYCVTLERNITLSRFKFLTPRQNEVKSFDDFCHDWELRGLRDSLVKDMIAIDTNNLCERNFSETDLTLELVIKAAERTT